MNHEAELLTTAREAAEAAAAVHREFHGRVSMKDAAEKGASDFVSHVDLQAETAALGVIRRRFPEHRVLSEEATGSIGSREDRPLWIVDPLDGTTNFLHTHPAYASSVGAVLDGEPLAGAVVAAATEERWWASRGGGAFRNGQRIHVSETRNLRQALIGTGFPFKRIGELPHFLREIEAVLPHCAGIRRGGAASLDFCYLAQGSLDAFWEVTLDPWDAAAGLLVLTEAGGLARRTDGSPLDVEASGSVLAANSAELLEALGERLEEARGRATFERETPAG